VDLSLWNHEVEATSFGVESSLIKLAGKELFVLPTHLILINLIIGNRAGKPGYPRWTNPCRVGSTQLMLHDK